jgi:hypothetical protein
MVHACIVLQNEREKTRIATYVRGEQGMSTALLPAYLPSFVMCLCFSVLHALPFLSFKKQKEC